MNKSIQTTVFLAGGIVLLVLGVGAGWWWASRQHENAMTMPAAAAQTSDTDKKVLYWYDPMYPQQHFDQPGKSPFMDMELVPRYASDGAANGNDNAVVQIDPRITQNLGMRLAAVERTPVATTIDATGLIAFNERDIVVEQVRTAGFVERVWPLAPGDVVAAGQPLVELRVPEWAAAQQEWLAVRASGDAELIAAARERMQQLGLSSAQVRELERSGVARSRFVLQASRSGVIQALDVRAGMTVMPGQTLARINGLDPVWLEVAVPEAQAESVREGSAVQARLPAFPDQLFAGQVIAVLPALNSNSRSLRLRMELANRDGQLRPGMTAQVQLGGESTNDRTGSALTVPTEAVIRTGKRALVIIADGDGRFLPTEVSLGQEIGNRTVIAAGVNEGQQVVTSGQFLIDSEASLSGVLARSATDADMSMPMDSMTDMASPALHEADATVKAIDGDQITLAHGPFESLGMPGMTMTFALADAQLAQGLSAGDRVRVGVSEREDGLVVERLEKRGAQP